MPRSFGWVAGVSLALVGACGTEKEAPPGVVTPSTGGSAGAGTTGGSSGRGSGGKGASGGSSARGGAGGSSGEDMGGAAGTEEGGAGGSSAAGGTATGGTGGKGAAGGAGGASGMASAGIGGTGIAGRGEEPDDCAPHGDDPPAAPGVCEPGASFGDAQAVAVTADAGDPLVAVTPDELTLLFMHVTSVGDAMIADRADVADDFGTPVRVGVDGVVGLSPDGLRVLVRAFDGTLQEAARAAPGAAFGAPSEGDFALINADAADAGATVSSPVIAPDDRTLYYLRVSAEGADYPLHVSTRSSPGSGAWPAGTPVMSCELKSFQGFNPVPTGVSSDGLTLFFWDSFYATARAAFRQTTAGSFVWVDDLGPRIQAQPNAACNRLYYSDDGIQYASSP